MSQIGFNNGIALRAYCSSLRRVYLVQLVQGRCGFLNYKTSELRINSRFLASSKNHQRNKLGETILEMAELSLKELKDLADDNEIDLSARNLTSVPKALCQVITSCHVLPYVLFNNIFHKYATNLLCCKKLGFQVPRLTHIDLGSNKIVVLPPSICTMTRLVRLELGSNLLGHLPDNIGDLVHLEHLDLYNNEIEDLPLSFANLCSLRWLDLKKNPLQPELLKAAGNCGNEKECKQAAVNVVSYMKELSKNHHEQMLQQQKVIEKIHEVKGETKEPTHKHKKKHNKKDSHTTTKNSDLLHVNNKTLLAQSRRPKTEEEVLRPTKLHHGLLFRMTRFLIKLLLTVITMGIIAITIGIVLSCTGLASAKLESKALCADLRRLSSMKMPSPRFFDNVRQAYGSMFRIYWLRLQSSVLALQMLWGKLHREFIKSDIGFAFDRLYHNCHTFVADTSSNVIQFLGTKREALIQWWDATGINQISDIVDTVKITAAILYEIGKDICELSIESLEGIYRRAEVFVHVWANNGLAKAIESSF
ncbi:leucine Rich repeat-containing domain protein [Dictyocaulus viviparus]|uniref:Leucine Rich repeat-containing domain protein n=1 Tax=Dictyocaulus viviparus TaxID=29172 RepID=A0A0D8XPJ7_DICVI|nr:leucine Rich repeat-containing domain protein [Dictyocaulus viviparus]